MNRLNFADVTPPATTADKATEILSATKVTLLKITVMMAILLFAVRHYLQ
jgi:hypothetical protein